MRKLLLTLLSCTMLHARHGVKAGHGHKAFEYYRTHAHVFIVYTHAGEFTRAERTALVGVCARKPLCLLGCRALAVSFCSPNSSSVPGTAVIFWDGRQISGEPFTGELAGDRLYEYVMQQVGDSAQALVNELGLEDHYHARQRSPGNSWYFGGYFPAWGAYPAWGSQPWGAFSLSMGFRRPQN